MRQETTGRGANDELLVEPRGSVCLGTVNRPEAYNAADEALHGEIARVWRRLAAYPDVRAIVLTGSGAAFSAAGDLQLLQRMVDDRRLRTRIMAEGLEIVQAMTAVSAPIVAAVNGPAVGLGCGLDAATKLAERLAALPPQAVVETKSVLNSAFRGAVGSWLPGAIEAETASFDEAAFRDNLSRLLQRKATS